MTATDPAARPARPWPLRSPPRPLPSALQGGRVLRTCGDWGRRRRWCSRRCRDRCSRRCREGCSRRRRRGARRSRGRAWAWGRGLGSLSLALRRRARSPCLVGLSRAHAFMRASCRRTCGPSAECGGMIGACRRPFWPLRFAMARPCSRTCGRACRSAVLHASWRSCRRAWLRSSPPRAQVRLRRCAWRSSLFCADLRLHREVRAAAVKGVRCTCWRAERDRAQQRCRDHA